MAVFLAAEVGFMCYVVLRFMLTATGHILGDLNQLIA